MKQDDIGTSIRKIERLSNVSGSLGDKRKSAEENCLVHAVGSVRRDTWIGAKISRSILNGVHECFVELAALE
jgi:hypothetical protein